MRKIFGIENIWKNVGIEKWVSSKVIGKHVNQYIVYTGLLK